MVAFENEFIKTSQFSIKAVHFYYLGLILFIVFSVSALLLPFPYNWIPFAVVAGIVFIFSVIKYPFVGMFMYLIIFFLEPNYLFPVLGNSPIPYELIIASIVLTSLVLNIAVIKKKIELFHLDYAVIAFIIACFLSIFGASDLQTAYDSFLKAFKIVLVYFLMVRIVNSPAKLKAVIVIYILSVAYLAIASTIAYYQGDFEFRQGIQRAHSPGGLIDPNTMATTLILGIPFMYYMAKSHKSVILKTLMFILMGAVFWTIVLTGSRAAMVGSFVVMMLIGWHSRYRYRAFALALVAVVIFIIVMPDQYQQRLISIGQIASSSEDDQFGAGASAYGRINGIILGFKFLLSNPLTGIGIGNFGFQHYASGGDWTNAHSLIGQVIGELGLFGVGAFIFFIIRFVGNIKFVRKKYKELKWEHDFVYYMTESVKIGIIMLFVQGLGGHNLFRTNWYSFAAFSMILVICISERQKKEKEISNIQTIQ